MMKYLKMPAAGIVRLSGPDGLDLLQRISTNDLSGLRDGEHADTVLTTEKGRIIDVVSVLRRSSEEVLLRVWSGDGSRVKNWIEKFIIMENVSAQTDDGCATYARFGGDGKPLEAGKWMSLTSSVGNLNLEWVVVAENSEKALVEGFDRNGDEAALPAELDDFRIRNRIPRWPEEISDQVNPHEVGLEGLISWTKGCYIGQEVIARLDSYNKVQKHLLNFELAVRPDAMPVSILSGGTEVGLLTSVTRDIPYLALGFVRSGYESASLQFKHHGGFIPLKRRD